MIQGKLRNGRVIVENEADASTLRNRGFVGTNIGQKLSIDLMTSLDLLARKKMQIFRRGNPLSFIQTRDLLSDSERSIASAYHFLRAKGLKPVIRNSRLMASGKRVFVCRDDETIDFSRIGGRSSYLAVVDREENCLLYTVNATRIAGRIRARGSSGNRSGGAKGLSRLLEARRIRIASGLKFGAEFRVYDGESPHARSLMMAENISPARDLVARVRIAQSVRKTFVQATSDKRGGFRLLEIKWSR